MIRRDTLAALRFGFGLGPGRPPPAGPEALLAGLDGPDTAAARWPVTPMAEHLATARALIAATRARQRGEGDGEKERRAARTARTRAVRHDLVQCLSRAAFGPDDLRERLVLFWANHFAAAGRSPRFRGTTAAHVEDAIRPHLAGDFATLLRAAILHPVMLQFLDQNRSAGPDSPQVRAQGRGGPNENLARELLELHTLGVGGSYGQDDVEALALLLTGLSFTLEEGFVFRPRMAERGTFRVLGRSYGGDRRPQLADIEAALDDLARHPDTAGHIARKLATHFVADDPDPDLVAHVAAAFRAGDGALRPVYAALLEHPAAWAPARRKIKPPFDFVASALRALGVGPDAMQRMRPAQVTRVLHQPLAQMGQPFFEPPSPAGWPEDGAHWLAPPVLAARIAWAMEGPDRLGETHDPRALVEAALAEAADAEVAFAAAAAETRSEGVGLVLASPAFNRR